MVTRKSAAERIILLELREAELRAEMEKICSRYGLLSQELLIIIEALKLDLRDELDQVCSRQSKFPNLGGYLVD